MHTKDCGANKIKTFEKNILDELNIKTVEYIDDINVLEDQFLAVNFKVAGAVLKQNVNKMKQALEAASAEKMAEYTAKVKAGEAVLVEGFDEAYDGSIFNVMTKTKEGIVSAECQADTVIALDVVLTDELIKEGALRDIIRQCQLIRKEAGYEVDQRVVMAISTEDELVKAVLESNKAYMCEELLADDIAIGGEIDADLKKEVAIADKNVAIAVKKA